MARWLPILNSVQQLHNLAQLPIVLSLGMAFYVGTTRRRRKIFSLYGDRKETEDSPVLERKKREITLKYKYDTSVIIDS